MDRKDLIRVELSKPADLREKPKKRRRGIRPPDAKMPPSIVMPLEVEEAEESPETSEE